MKILRYLILLSLILNFSLFGQSFSYNLKNLNNLSINLQDRQNRLSSKIRHKMITETKLKLRSAGIKITQDDTSEGRIIISIDVIKSNFAQHRILIQFGVFEKVQTFRKDKEITNAFTYYDESFFKGKNINESVYSEYMDNILIRFIDRYLSDNN